MRETLKSKKLPYRCGFLTNLAAIGDCEYVSLHRLLKATLSCSTADNVDIMMWLWAYCCCMLFSIILHYITMFALFWPDLGNRASWQSSFHQLRPVWSSCKVMIPLLGRSDLSVYAETRAQKSEIQSCWLTAACGVWWGVFLLHSASLDAQFSRMHWTPQGLWLMR